MMPITSDNKLGRFPLNGTEGLQYKLWSICTHGTHHWEKDEEQAESRYTV